MMEQEIKKQAMLGNAMLGSRESLAPSPPRPKGLCAHIDTARNQIPVLRECIETLISLDGRINGNRAMPTPDENAKTAPDGMTDDLGMVANEIAELAEHIRRLIAGIHESL